MSGGPQTSDLARAALLSAASDSQGHHLPSAQCHVQVSRFAAAAPRPKKRYSSRNPEFLRSGICTTK